MRHSLLVFIALAGAVSLGSLEIRQNGIEYASYGDSELLPLSYRTPAGSPAVAVGDILPVAIDAYEARIEYRGGSAAVEGAEAVSLLFTADLVLSADGWDLRIGKDTYPGTVTIDIRGEAVPDRELEIWIDWEGTRELAAEIRRFSNLHGLRVTLTETPKISAKLLSVARGRGRLPDVVMIQSGFFHSLVESRVLQNLDGMELPGLSGSGVDAFRYGGRLWGAPLYYDTQLLFYDRKTVSDADVRGLTLGSLESLAERLAGTGTIPLCWQAYSIMWFIPFQLGFGKESIVNAGGGVTIDDPSGIHALEYITALINKRYLEPVDRDAMHNLFLAGKASVILSGSYMIPAFVESGKDFGAAAYPLNESTGRYVSPLLDFKALAITRTTRRPVLARRLVSYLTGAGVQNRFPASVAKLPAMESALDSSSYPELFRDALVTSAKIGTVIPPGPEFQVYKNVMWKLMNLALSGKMSPADTLRMGQGIIEERLEISNGY